MKRYPTAVIALALAGFAGLATQNDCIAQEVVEPGSRYVRIGHFQCRCQQGDFEANLQTVVQGLELAAEANLDIDKKYRNRHTWRSVTSANQLNDELLHALEAAKTR